MEPETLKFKKRNGFSQKQNFIRGKRRTNADLSLSGFDEEQYHVEQTSALINKQMTLKNKLINDLQRNNSSFIFEQNNYIDAIPFVIPLNAKKVFNNV